VREYVRFRDLVANGRTSNVTVDEAYNGWHPDPFGRFDERYIVYGEPSRLVRNEGVEQTDRQPLTFETPAVPTVEDPDSSPLAQTGDEAGPVPIVSSRFRLRRSRARIIGVVAILLACALIATVLVSRQHTHRATPAPVGGPLPQKRVKATTPIPDRRTPRSSQRASVPSPATPRRGPSGHSAPTAAERARAPIVAWANVLLSDIDNVNEVAYDYGRGPLEQTACQRTWSDAAKIPAATLPPVISAAANVASHDIMTFASECARAPGCLRDRARCDQNMFADAYRLSVHDLDALRADLSK
jgi:hypothetical protein